MKRKTEVTLMQIIESLGVLTLVIFIILLLRLYLFFPVDIEEKKNSLILGICITVLVIILAPGRIETFSKFLKMKRK